MKTLLHERTLKKLTEFRNFVFLSNAGDPSRFDEASIKDWPSAVQMSKSNEWQCILLHIVNRTNAELLRIDWHRGNIGNDRVREIRDGLEKIAICDRARADLDRISALDHVVPLLKSYLIAICLETEYEDIIEPRVAVPMIEPLLWRGKFPCGWTGPAEYRSDWNGNPRDYKVLFI